jgi:site-specific recombinase XerC
VTRGRKRRFDPSIPSHIDQKKLPVGVYWNRRDRNWYTLVGNPAKRQQVAGEDALMSDLHKAMEAVRGVKTDTLEYLLCQFDKSKRFRGLAPKTQEGYGYAHEALRRHPTKLGVPFSDLPLSAVTMPLVQRLVDQIAEEYPTKANAVKRYLSVAFSWGMRRGLCASNPAKGIEEAKERRAHRMPAQDTMHAVIGLFRARGAYIARRKGALAPYLWAVATIAYLCRMRGVEVRNLSDDSEDAEGLMVVRVKGSLPTLVRWSPELREAHRWLLERRAEVWARRRTPIPLAAKDRPLVVTEDGVRMTKSAMSTAWRRGMAAAIAEGLIESEERFGVHGLKHRGITDTAGTAEDKQQASGHKTRQMVHLYDHEVPTVDVAGKRVKKPAK